MEKEILMMDNKLVRKVTLLGIFSLITGVIVVSLLHVFETQATPVMMMMVWIITTLLIMIAVLIEDMDEDIRFLMKQQLVETKLLREEIRLLKRKKIK